MKKLVPGSWVWTLAVAVLAGGAPACDDTDEGGPDASRDARPASDGRVSDAPADAPADGGGSVADASREVGGDAGMITAFRPERQAFSPALVQQLRVPTGFRVQVFASGLGNPRMMAVTPEGDIYVTEREMSQVLRLRDINGDGDASDDGERVVAASAMETPSLMGVHGITYHMGRVYLATVTSVLSATPAGGRLTAVQPLVMDLPDGGQHPNRTLAVGPDGKLYVSVGSTCNACAETNPQHATMLRFELDGSPSANPANPQHPMLAQNPMAMTSPRVFASGLRNTIGFDWHPMNGQLWGSDHGSDGLGDDVPPDEIVQITGGKSYGWPYCYGKRMVDPVIDQPRPDLTKAAYCATTEASTAEYQAHSAPIGFLFYRGTQFPADFRGDAFVAFRGSWNRSVPTGYKIVRVRFSGTGPETTAAGGWQEDFVSGFLDPSGKTYFGRPAGLAVDATGALLIAEDTNGVVYRVSYGSAAPGGDAGTPSRDGGAMPDAPPADAGAADAGAADAGASD
jgi:glucose/arabinose dehydrogenase